jgi:hypothetical protein
VNVDPPSGHLTGAITCIARTQCAVCDFHILPGEDMCLIAIGWTHVVCSLEEE